MRKKGQPLSEYNELKTRITVSITPTAVNGIDAIAKSMNLSRSELLERIGRGMLQVSAAQQERPGD
jgi:metal-responsive CopG/Arc/MetJ family transcriptional regulator